VTDRPIKTLLTWQAGLGGPGKGRPGRRSIAAAAAELGGELFPLLLDERVASCSGHVVRGRGGRGGGGGGCSDHRRGRHLRLKVLMIIGKIKFFSRKEYSRIVKTNEWIFIALDNVFMCR
jgi:hypothetical protein